MWTEIQNKEDLLPSWDSLSYHWLRTCWASSMYQQVYDPHPHLLDPSEYGWQLKDGQPQIHWDTQENMESVRSRVRRLMKGCSCKSGCQRQSNCGCRKKDQDCGSGWRWGLHYTLRVSIASPKYNIQAAFEAKRPTNKPHYMYIHSKLTLLHVCPCHCTTDAMDAQMWHHRVLAVTWMIMKMMTSTDHRHQVLVLEQSL